MSPSTKGSDANSDATERRKLDPYCPVRNVAASYPPTLLIHGTADTDVPYEQSVEMDRELARRNIPHELVTVPGAGHGLAGGDKKLVDAATLAVIASSLDGIPETFRDPEHGRLVPTRDSDALARAMITLAEDPSAARAMGEHGRQWILQRYSLSRLGARRSRTRLKIVD